MLTPKSEVSPLLLVKLTSGNDPEPDSLLSSFTF